MMPARTPKKTNKPNFLSHELSDNLLEFSLENCRLVAFKIKALKPFGGTDYQDWIRKLIDDGTLKQEQFDDYRSHLSRWHQWFDSRETKDAKAAARAARAASKAEKLGRERPSSLRKREVPWHDKRIKAIFSRLAFHVHKKAPTLPREILNNLELLIPDAIYHALYAKMKMTAGNVHQINKLFFGKSDPDKDQSTVFNIFRHSCEEDHPIAHGTLTITYNHSTRAHKTVEEYEINGMPYYLTGSLVQPGQSYRIFSTHGDADTTIAQVMLVSHTGSLYRGRRKGHEHLKDQVREMQGVILDVHKPHTTYATRVLIRRPDTTHPALKPGTMPTKADHPWYEGHKEMRSVREYVSRALTHKNIFRNQNVIGFR